MSEEIDSDEPTGKQYAKEVLSGSLITGLPSIINAPTVSRKTIKSFVLCLCLTGFLYQTSTFLSYVLTYPSDADFEMEAPKQILSPALTICDNNGIYRSKFCDEFPEKCETPEDKEQFCHKYPDYCVEEIDWDDFKVPKVQYYSYERNATMGNFKELRLNGSSFIHVYRSLFHFDIQGPFILFKDMSLGTVCYTINSRVNKSRPPGRMKVFSDDIQKLKDPKMVIQLTLDKTESFLPGRAAGAWLSLHSPFEFSNPYYQGTFLNPDKRYSVNFQLGIEELLENPYRTNCRNYTESWEKNGYQGATSKAVCREMCDLKATLEWCSNCSDKYIDYPRDEDACFVEWTECNDRYPVETFRTCSRTSDCREDCVKYKFSYTLDGRPNHDKRLLDSNITADERKTVVELYLADREVLYIRHRPHYRDVEVFSYIGGYVGIWLGISLVAVADFFESLFHIAVFTFKRRRQSRK